MVDKTLHRKLNIGQHVKKRSKANSPTSQILEELVVVSASLPIFHISRTTHIKDGMALLQSINARIYSNLGELAMELVRNKLTCFQFVYIVKWFLDLHSPLAMQEKTILVDICFVVKTL